MSTAARNRYWFLDSVAGWRESAASLAGPAPLARTDPNGDLILSPLPGGAELFQGKTPVNRAGFHDPAWVHVQQSLRCPVALAPDACRKRIYVADAAADRIAWIHWDTGAIAALHSIGGAGTAVRSLKHPRGVAVLDCGNVAVCDTENHRVQIFTLYPHALVQLWGAADAQPGGGPREFHWPWGIATDSAGNVFVADRGNRRIQKIRSDGTWLRDIGAAVLKDPTQVAVSPSGDVAVVDSGAAVVVFPANGAAALTIALTEPLSVAFNGDGDLYAGNALGVVYKIELDARIASGYRIAGEGVTGLADPIVSLAWGGDLGLLSIVRELANNGRQRVWSVNPEASYPLAGVFETDALDSGIEDCVWHRVECGGPVPDGTSVLIESSTAAKPLDPQQAPQFTEPVQCMLGGGDDPDCLVQSVPGQLLKLRITLRSNGLSSPRIHSIKAFFPRDSYLRYLPAVFQQDPESRDFLDRFLSIFQTSFDGLDQMIDSFRQLFDPMTVPQKYLGWLAAWLALPIQPSWTTTQLRAMVKKAFTEYSRRGTPGGLVEAIQDYAGVPASVLEHYRLRRWPLLPSASTLCAGSRLWSRSFYQQLQVGEHSEVGSFRLATATQPAMEPLHWGAHQFTVFFVSNPYTTDTIRKAVQEVVDREKPAHTSASVCPVFPRFRVGVQSTVGVDSIVGDISYLVLNRKQPDGTASPGRLARLGYDSILGCSPAERNIAELRTNARPRVGVNSRIL